MLSKTLINLVHKRRAEENRYTHACRMVLEITPTSGPERRGEREERGGERGRGGGGREREERGGEGRGAGEGKRAERPSKLMGVRQSKS